MSTKKPKTETTPATPKAPRQPRQVDPAMAEARAKAKQILIDAKTASKENKILNKIDKLLAQLGPKGIETIHERIEDYVQRIAAVVNE